jgi:hypothetical protein
LKGSGQGLFLWRRNPFEIKVISEKPINQESLLFMGGLISKTKDPGVPGSAFVGRRFTNFAARKMLYLRCHI